MSAKSKVISVAAARRRERKISRDLMQACKIIATRDETIKLRGEQIGDLIKQKEDLRRQLEFAANLTAADAKVIADVLRAHGAEDAEARLRTTASTCEEQYRRIAGDERVLTASARNEERRS